EEAGTGSVAPGTPRPTGRPSQTALAEMPSRPSLLGAGSLGSSADAIRAALGETGGSAPPAPAVCSAPPERASAGPAFGSPVATSPPPALPPLGLGGSPFGDGPRGAPSATLSGRPSDPVFRRRTDPRGITEVGLASLETGDPSLLSPERA